LTRRASRVSLETACAHNPESVGRRIAASTTVVSTRSRRDRSTFRSTASDNNSALSSSSSPGPSRFDSFINVLGSGTRPSSAIRQNRRHVNESATSRKSVSYPSPYRCFRYVSRRYVSVGIVGRPIRAVSRDRKGARNRSSSSTPSTLASSGGN
jgi:hypothetical protein